MKPIDAETLDAATVGPWFWLRTFNCARESLLEHLGRPHWTEPEDGKLPSLANGR